MINNWGHVTWQSCLTRLSAAFLWISRLECDFLCPAFPSPTINNAQQVWIFRVFWRYFLICLIPLYFCKYLFKCRHGEWPRFNFLLYKIPLALVIDILYITVHNGYWNAKTSLFEKLWYGPKFKPCYKLWTSWIRLEVHKWNQVYSKRPRSGESI